MKLLVELVDFRQNILLLFPYPIEILRVLQNCDNIRGRHRIDQVKNFKNDNNQSLPKIYSSVLTFLLPTTFLSDHFGIENGKQKRN